jgi:hypothetical protein
MFFRQTGFFDETPSMSAYLPATPSLSDTSDEGLFSREYKVSASYAVVAEVERQFFYRPVCN